MTEKNEFSLSQKISFCLFESQLQKLSMCVGVFQVCGKAHTDWCEVSICQQKDLNLSAHTVVWALFLLPLDENYFLGIVEKGG